MKKKKSYRSLNQGVDIALTAGDKKQTALLGATIIVLKENDQSQSRPVTVSF